MHYDLPERVTPSVLGTGADGFGGPGDAPVPEHVYVPSRRARKGDQEVVLELRAMEAGGTALLAYASLGELVAHCGTGQPWIAVPFERLDNLRQLSGASMVVWDATLTEDQRHGGES